ncbi:hypothetical protein FLACHUCJ7_04632 [Flavobacterium chungangense]|uniref:Uncharacterized protein n=1 Tax=Flavobacterium chungangense TaxID=554283 RepID=A0A6V6ZGB7_9FLAO|nr:hypothetical protein FLACHUCJ7_04632 [Flavobacterium chungangense]
MNFYIKNLITYLYLIVLSPIVFLLYVYFQHYSGQHVLIGLILMILNCLIASVLSFLLLFIFKRSSQISLFKSSLIFSIVYGLTLLIIFDINPFQYHQTEIQNIKRCFLFSEIIAWSTLCILLKVTRNFE